MTTKTCQSITYRQLTCDELYKYKQLDRTEQVDHIHYLREGKLVLEAEHWDVPDWSPEEKQRRIRRFRDLWAKGATFFGAFDGETLVGISILDHTPVATGVNRLNLDGLWVSHGYRAKGIGRRLFSLAAQEARSRGARSMYVSATPSKNTIRFYLEMGCQLADPIDPELFEHEPEDIHLERILVPVRDLYREEEIQALILLSELSDPVETPNNNHYTFYPKTVEQAQTYFRRFALPLDDAYASLAEKGLTQSVDGSWALTDRGRHVANRVRALRPPIYYFYRDYYAAIEHSAAFAEYAERVFGQDLGQHGISDLGQLHHMLDLVELARGSCVLDVGCGNGKIAEYISDQTGAHVTGIDYVPEAIDQAQRRTQSKRDRLRFEVGDIETLRIMQNPRIHGTPPYVTAVIHGGPGAGGEMAPVARELSRDRGILEPIQTEVSLQGQVDELRDLLLEHAQLPVILIGYSWGAWLSYLLTAYHPNMVHRLILVSSGPFEPQYVSALTETRLSRLSPTEQSEWRQTLAQLQDPTTADKDAALARLGKLSSKTDTYDPLPHEPDGEEHVGPRGEIFQNVWHAAAQMREDGSLLELAHQIRCPVVAIHGDYDPHPAEGVERPLRAILPDFAFVLIEHCGHTPWLERQARDRFYEVLRAAL